MAGATSCPVAAAADIEEKPRESAAAVRLEARESELLLREFESVKARAAARRC
jgi:hypothetical protein